MNVEEVERANKTQEKRNDFLNVLDHASYCLDNDCIFPLCCRVRKTIFRHENNCKEINCIKCRKCKKLRKYHALKCVRKSCKVLYCEEFKKEFRKLEDNNCHQHILSFQLLFDAIWIKEQNNTKL